jgi:putative transposase
MSRTGLVFVVETKTKTRILKKLKTSRIIKLAVGTIRGNLNLNAGKNVTYSTRIILLHLLNACCCLGSINHISTSSENAPTEGAVRHRLKGLEDIEAKVNVILKEHVLKTLPRRPLIFAIDFTLIPYYGDAENDGDVVRTKAKKGTCSFFAYATIYTILRNKRYTLAVKHVRKGEKLTDVIDFLLGEVTGATLKIGRLYLDREFYTIDVINHLKDREIPFIIPCVARGKSGGIRALLRGRKSYSTTYTMRSGEKEATFQVNVVARYYRGRRNRRGMEYFTFAVSGVDVLAGKTHKEYRRRFGIETSYRLMNAARARTTSRSPVLRLLYIGLGFLLMNLWIYLHWLYVSVRRQGGRQLAEWRFKTMLRQVARGIEDILGFAEDVTIRV